MELGIRQRKGCKGICRSGASRPVAIVPAAESRRGISASLEQDCKLAFALFPGFVLTTRSLSCALWLPVNGYSRLLFRLETKALLSGQLKLLATITGKTWGVS